MSKIRLLLSGKGNIQYYVEAINNLGGEAMAEYPPKIDTSFDGLLLCGGGDVDPKFYNEEINGSTNIDIERDEIEFALMEAFLKAGKPIMGICRGHQLINIYFGGSLYQDLPEAEMHKGGKAHEVKAEQGSLLHSLYGESFSVNSTHHQAVKKVGKGLHATAFWNDKYIEATEHETLPIISVQWHPERMCFSMKREDTVDGAPIIKHFLEMCEKNK